MVAGAEPVMDQTLLHEEVPHIFLMSTWVPVSLKVYSTYLCIVDFSLYGQPYTFTIDKWRSSRLRKFLEMFHAHASRVIDQFGCILSDSEGNLSNNMDVRQKVNAAVQGCKDVMGCLDKIAKHYKRSVLDYAVWYRERRPRRDDEGYSQFITLLICHLIVHADFLAPNVQWELVEFT
jgi:hypothetical protein